MLPRGRRQSKKYSGYGFATATGWRTACLSHGRKSTTATFTTSRMRLASSTWSSSVWCCPHLREPFYALSQTTRLSREAVIITQQAPKDDAPIAYFIPNARMNPDEHEPYWHGGCSAKAASERCCRCSVLKSNRSRGKSTCALAGIPLAPEECLTIVARRRNSVMQSWLICWRLRYGEISEGVKCDLYPCQRGQRSLHAVCMQFFMQNGAISWQISATLFLVQPQAVLRISC